MRDAKNSIWRDANGLVLVLLSLVATIAFTSITNAEINGSLDVLASLSDTGGESRCLFSKLFG